MSLGSFETLEAAKLYAVTSYEDISRGMASQFFGVTGMLDVLEANTSNATPVQLTPEMPPTSLGALCRTVLSSAKTTGFPSDPLQEDGALNRAGAQALVAAKLFTQPLVDAFWLKGERVMYPHASATNADFARDKGLMTYTADIQQGSGFIKLTVSENCEAHRPKIFATVQGIKTQVGTAPEINLAGDYLARVPTNHTAYIVENFYGVIS